jgi:hypothetical protein
MTTTFVRLAALCTSLSFFYFLFTIGTWVDLVKFGCALFAIVLLIYSIIGARLKGEGSIYTEDFMVNMKKDIDILKDK